MTDRRQEDTNRYRRRPRSGMKAEGVRHHSRRPKPRISGSRCCTRSRPVRWTPISTKSSTPATAIAGATGSSTAPSKASIAKRARSTAKRYNTAMLCQHYCLGGPAIERTGRLTVIVEHGIFRAIGPIARRDTRVFPSHPIEDADPGTAMKWRHGDVTR